MLWNEQYHWKHLRNWWEKSKIGLIDHIKVVRLLQNLRIWSLITHKSTNKPTIAHQIISNKLPNLLQNKKTQTPNLISNPFSPLNRLTPVPPLPTFIITLMIKLFFIFDNQVEFIIILSIVAPVDFAKQICPYSSK